MKYALLCFPRTGARSGVGKALYEAFLGQGRLRRADDALSQHLARLISRGRTTLKLTANTQPAITTSVAALRALENELT